MLIGYPAGWPLWGKVVYTAAAVFLAVGWPFLLDWLDRREAATYRAEGEPSPLVRVGGEDWHTPMTTFERLRRYTEDQA